MATSARVTRSAATLKEGKVSAGSLVVSTSRL